MRMIGDTVLVPTEHGAIVLRLLLVEEAQDGAADGQLTGPFHYAVACPDGHAWQPGKTYLLEVEDRAIGHFRSHAAAASAVVAFWQSHSDRFTEHRTLVQQGVEALGWLKSNEVLSAAEIVAALGLHVPFKGEPAAILRRVISSQDVRTGTPRRLYRMWEHLLSVDPRLTAVLLYNLSVPDSRARLVQRAENGSLSGYTDVRYAVETLRVLAASGLSLPGMQDADAKWRKAAAMSRKLSTMLGLYGAFPPSDQLEHIRNTRLIILDCIKAAGVLDMDIAFADEAFAPPSQAHSGVASGQQ